MTANCIDCGTPVGDCVGTYCVCDDCFERYYKKNLIKEVKKSEISMHELPLFIRNLMFALAVIMIISLLLMFYAIK